MILLLVLSFFFLSFPLSCMELTKQPYYGRPLFVLPCECRPREIKRSSVKLASSIGQGNFGAVMEGILDESRCGGGAPYIVAVKTVKDGMQEAAERKAIDELHKEAAVMAFVSPHANVLSIIGCVTVG